MRKLSLFGVFFIVLIFLAVPAYVGYGEDEPTLDWVAYYDGPAVPGVDNDRSEAIAMDSFGNIYVTGTISGSGAPDYWDYATVKYDRSGNQKWVAIFNGPSNNSDRAKGIAVDSFNNVYVTGTEYTATSGADITTIKYDSNTGEVLWTARYSTWTGDEARAIAVDSEDNIYVAGNTATWTTKTDYLVIKYSIEGEQLWASKYNGPGNGYERPWAIAIDSEDNVFVTGSSQEIGTGDDIVTVGFDKDGELLWAATYHSPEGNMLDKGYAISIGPSGNVYVAGVSNGVGTTYDYFTICYDSRNGEELWYVRYNGPGNGVDIAYGIAVDSSENIYVTGHSLGDTSKDIATVKYNSEGKKIWERRFDSSFNDEAISITLDMFGNIYVAGTIWRGGMVVLKYNSSGDEQWVIRYSSPYYGYETAVDIVVELFGNVYVTGHGKKSGGWTDSDFITFKYHHNLSSEEQIDALISKADELLGSGNPLTGILTGAKNSLRAGDNPGTCNILQEAFITQVEILIIRGKISEEDGQVLIDAANEIINELCGQ